MSQDQRASHSKIDYFDIEPLPRKPSDATTIRVFRHVAAYYGQEAHRALAGMCIGLGGSMRRAATTLHGSAIAIENAALVRLPLSAVDLKVLRDAETAAVALITWLNHEPLHACRRELERRQKMGSKPPSARSDIDDKQLAQGAAGFLCGKIEFRQARSDDRLRPKPSRYLVAELEPTIWRIPFELPLNDLAEAFEIFAMRSQLHVQMYGEPRPMILLDRVTNTILRSASDAPPASVTMTSDLSAWLEEGIPVNGRERESASEDTNP